jgi:hypothetical protein
MANMELITSVTVGSGGAASVTLPATGTIPQTYTDLKLVFSARTNRADTFDCLLVKPNNSSSNLTYRYIRGDGSTASSNTLSRFDINGNSATASTFGNGELYIPNYAGSNYKSMSGDSVTENNATEALSGLHAWLWSDTSAITTLVCAPQFGTLFLEGSTFYLYGISNVTSGSKATGGIVSSDGTYWYHMFPYSGTFTPTTNITADYLVIAGGGAGGVGGGGAGGYRTSIGGSPLSLTATSYSVTVGAGGATGSPPTSGSDSVFSTITSTGGGRGSTGVTVFSGGSGGGGGNDATDFGLGNTPSTSPSQGNNGGQRANGQTSGGGGGAGSVGGNATATSPTNTGGAGGNGSNSASTWAIATQTGVNGYYAGGGGGGGAGGGTFATSGGGLGGLGGGGNGELNGVTGRPAIINTGSGGGGGYHQSTAGTGGSGLVIIRYAI